VKRAKIRSDSDFIPRIREGLQEMIRPEREDIRFAPGMRLANLESEIRELLTMIGEGGE